MEKTCSKTDFFKIKDCLCTHFAFSESMVASSTLNERESAQVIKMRDKYYTVNFTN